MKHSAVKRLSSSRSRLNRKDSFSVTTLVSIFFIGKSYRTAFKQFRLDRLDSGYYPIRTLFVVSQVISCLWRPKSYKSLQVDPITQGLHYDITTNVLGTLLKLDTILSYTEQKKVVYSFSNPPKNLELYLFFHGKNEYPPPGRRINYFVNFLRADRTSIINPQTCLRVQSFKELKASRSYTTLSGRQ